jgi:hypothetical protein
MTNPTNQTPDAWVITLEQIVVPGANVTEATSNALVHLTDKFLGGELPLIIKAERKPLEEIQNDSTIETN